MNYNLSALLQRKREGEGEAECTLVYSPVFRPRCTVWASQHTTPPTPPPAAAAVVVAFPVPAETDW